MTEETQIILEVNDSFYRAFEKKDITTMNQIWWQGNGSICIHPGGKLIRGWDNIRASWEKIFQNTDYLEINFEVVTTEVDYAIAQVIVMENVMQVQRRRKIQAQSLATNTFRKMAQKWYLIHHHGSPIMSN
ncbi:MAG: nuclear transport factor 2 family protein [Halothece sp. Uz-M2-17]|nr:nuclear transport factor 2 family protein [Halothece sp. Uz-M2-17]